MIVEPEEVDASTPTRLPECSVSSCCHVDTIDCDCCVREAFVRTGKHPLEVDGSYWTHDSRSQRERWTFHEDPIVTKKRKFIVEEFLDRRIPSPLSRRQRQTTSSSGRSGFGSKTLEDSLNLPVTLHNVLAEEKCWITRTGISSTCGAKPRPLRRVHLLPATLTVHQVLEHFQNKVGEERAPRDRVQQFCMNVKDIFDKALPSLLYPEEIPQYDCRRAQTNTRVCEVYGCHFLLRLLHRSPISAHSNIRGLLLIDLIGLLQKNRQVCFRHSYREPLYDELLDWEKAVVDADKPDFGCSLPISIHAVEDDNDSSTEMAVSPSKKTRFGGPHGWY